jgi:protein-S-isoprenylcysteine O-methyltransferase Ste14
VDDDAYGLWLLVFINSAIFIIFALSFFRPRTKRDWRAMGAFSAFIVALFTEMYGFPVTIYLLASWLGSRLPDLSLTHSGGHLWNDLIGWTGDAHLSPFHIASDVLIVAGFLMIATAWRELWGSMRGGRLAVSGPYARLRHPQYAGFLLIMVGFLIQWPTLATLAMFPVLVLVYRRLASGEEREVRQLFGAEWDAYAARTPRFLPHFGRKRRSHPDPRAMCARTAGNEDVDRSR